MFVKGPGGDATNIGQISAAQVELKSKGGNVYALAGNDGGQISATGTATINGQAWLIADGGKTTVTGTVLAKNANGVGGNIETSGHDLDISRATVKTGQGGNWLLDPLDVTIDSAAATTIQNSLATTNVTVQTTSTTASGPGTQAPGNGDITVGSNIGWSSNNSLTLSAYRNIGVTNGVTLSNTGAGSLTLRADNASTGTGTVNLSGANQLDFSASTGNVALLYNPSSYASPTSYVSNVHANSSWIAPTDGSVTSQFTAYMLVNSAANLSNIATNRSGVYAFGQNIDASSIPNFAPMWTDVTGFTGVLDGRSSTLNNLTISATTGTVVGLFGNIGTSGQVRNLNLTNASVTQSIASGSISGTLSGDNAGNIANVTVAGTIHDGTHMFETGGLVGYNNGTIRNSSSSVTIDSSANTSSANTYIGGLIGSNHGPISNAYATGSVNAGQALYVGGLAGNNLSTVTNSYATGSVVSTGVSSRVGGLIGTNFGAITGSHASASTSNASANADIGGLTGYNSAAISNSYALGTVTSNGANSDAGGLAGYNDVGGTLSGSYATGTVIAGSNADVGGLAGYNAAAISNSYATGTVTSNGGNVDAGGLVGYNHSGGTVSGSYATGAVTAGVSSDVGGLAGYNAAAVSNSHATGSASSTGANSDAGGLVGYNDIGGTLSGTYATGLVSAGQYSGVGGLAGYNVAAVSNSYASGSVSSNADSSTGGLIGDNEAGGILSGDYATGPVTGGSGSDVGGLVGYGYSAAITNSYATGSVTAADGIAGTPSFLGGLVGYAGTGSTIATSHAAGSVAGGQFVIAGGLAGADYAAITSSYASGAIAVEPTGVNGSSGGGLVGQSYAPISGSHAVGSVTGGTNTLVGGLVGRSFAGATITSSYATGAVTTADGAAAGGLTGWNQAAITGSYATGSVTGTSGSYVGGLSGRAFTPISTSYATGTVTGGASSYVGGLVGRTLSGAPVASSYATGSVLGGDHAFVGGLTGYNQDAITLSYASGSASGGLQSQVGGLSGVSLAPISVSYATGPVTAGTGGSYLGGLVGSESSSLTDTYARGAVTGTDPNGYTGGLVGLLQNPASITHSYSSGSVISAGSAEAGGLVGLGFGTIVQSYWDDQASGFSTLGIGAGPSTGATPLTTAQLQSGLMPVGFNSTNSVWVAPANVYPYFGWQGPLVTISGTAYNGSSLLPSAGVGVLSGGSLLASLTTNSNGFYTLAEPSNMVNSSGVLTFLTTGGHANTFSDGAGSNGFTLMDLQTNTVSLLNASNATLSGLNAAAANALGGNTGLNFLFTVPNGQLSLNVGSNLSIASSAAALTLDQPLAISGNILINSTGNLNIASTQSLSPGSGNAVTLSTGGAFTNNAGASALNVSGGGRWLVYSQNPANDNRGGLAYDFKQYNATYGVTSPAQTTGNGFLYTLAPMLSASLTGTATKTYDSTVSAPLTNLTLNATGTIDGDSVAVAASTTTYANKNVGTGKTISATGVNVTSATNGGANVYGYQLSSTAASGNVGTITPATISQTIYASTRPYNGTTGTTGSLGPRTGILGGDQVSVSTANASYNFADKNVGNGKTVTASGLTLTGADSGNYLLNANVGPSNIYVALVTLSGTANNKVYDGTTAATGSAAISSGIFGSDQVYLGGYSLAFSNKNAGSNKSVHLTGFLTGAGASNYQINPEFYFHATVTPAPLTDTFTANNKVYDGTTTTAGTLGNLSSVITGDSVSTSGTAAYNFADKNAGIGKTVSIAGVTLSGADAANYTLTLTPTGTANVTPAQLTDTFTANNKVYDGTTTATATLSNLVGVITGDSVVTSGTAAYNFANKNAGIGKTVSVAGVTLSGTDAANYTLTLTPAGTASITPAQLIETFTASNKVYDATTTATGALGSLSGVIAGDSVATSGTAAFNFADKNAGTSKTVMGSGLTLIGTDAANYMLAMTPTGTPNITPAQLTDTFTANNKVYDGTTTATATLGNLAGVIAGDSVATGTAAFNFADKNAGIGKTVSVAGVTLSGTDAANYTLTLTPTGTANITPAQLTETFTASNKVYDGTTSATATLGNLVGVIAGDSVATSGTAAYTFADKNAGNAKAVSGSGLTLSGSDASNYSLTLLQAGTAAITPAQLLYVANSGVTRDFGANNPTFSGAVTGLVGGDTLASVATGTPAFASVATISSNTGLFPVNGSGLTLTTGNYTLSQASGNLNALTINPITITIGSFTRQSGQPNPTFSVSYAGSESAYLQSLLSGLTLVTDAPANNAPGTYQITAVIPQALAGNFIVRPGAFTITSGPAVSGAATNNAALISSVAQSPQAILPASLQTQSIPPPPPLPSLATSNLLLPANAGGLFQIVIMPSSSGNLTEQSASGSALQSNQTSGDALSSASFTDSSPDGRTSDKRSTYAAGAHQ